ncbi:MAG: glycosyl transferase, partial [Alistipes sp.]|nr:glycosyl transferase [Alistipes sp.]
MLKKLKKGLKNPRLFVLGALFLVARLIPDKLYLSIYYRLNMRKQLDWSDLQTYNEKLQWLKIYNRKPEMTEMVDKDQAKRYVAERIGEEYIIPTLGIYDSVEDIDFDALPNQFVLKCTHDSGGIVICTDKSGLDKDAARKKLRKFLKRGYFWLNREWPYKHVPRRIIAEQYMVDESGYELKDYKFFCFDGEPKALFIATDRGRKDEETKFDFFDMDFNH